VLHYLKSRFLLFFSSLKYELGHAFLTSRVFPDIFIDYVDWVSYVYIYIYSYLIELQKLNYIENDLEVTLLAILKEKTINIYNIFDCV